VLTTNQCPRRSLEAIDNCSFVDWCKTTSRPRPGTAPTETISCRRWGTCDSSPPELSWIEIPWLGTGDTTVAVNKPVVQCAPRRVEIPPSQIHPSWLHTPNTPNASKHSSGSPLARRKSDTNTWCRRYILLPEPKRVSIL